ncbi:hypothetical protein [uncultured Desulfovibrio sp.]|uniref:hypothetical protein n=1 Tax=uncultured Desulfovibrio sp. TaxID=167968 RepID=UPI00261654B9|nr:hypothetical protein [uncultured Desulfovibrio sp.]
MAIIDRNAVFFEGPLTADAQSATVALTALKLPGRMEPMPMRVSVTQAFMPEEVQGLSFTLEEADAPDAASDAWFVVPGAVWSFTGEQLGPGARLGPRFLPQGVRKPWLRLSFTLTPQSGKSVSAGRIFAALLREEDLPYEAALQVK